MEWALIVVLGVGLAMLAWSSERRHRRLRRRIARLDRREMELLHAIKPLYGSRAEQRLERAGRRARMPVEFRSQFGEDLLLDELFAGQPDGFFIEVGAYDGYTYAVTYALEAQGWSGLLIEPVAALHALAAARRPGSRVVHAAVSKRGSSGTAVFTRLGGATGGGGYDASSHLEAIDQGFTKRPPRTASERVEVPLTTIDALLAHHTGPIDLVVLDVEGHELALLDGFDLARFQPRVIVVEDHALGRDSALVAHLSARGYEHVCWLSYNRVLVRSDEPALVERARRIAQQTATATTAG